jgi:hypothetical protein
LPKDLAVLIIFQMPRLFLDLPEDIRSRLQTRADQAGHTSIEEYIAALIHADLTAGTADAAYGAPEAIKVRSQADLEARLHEGLNSPASEMTPSDWDDMRRRLLERHAVRGSNH